MNHKLSFFSIDTLSDKYINYPKSVVIGDVRYPAKIFELWSQSEKEAIGIYEIVVDKTNYKDPAYYNNTDSSYTFANGQVTESWGTATPKRLNDENAVDEDGNNILDDDTLEINVYAVNYNVLRFSQGLSGLGFNY